MLYSCPMKPPALPRASGLPPRRIAGYKVMALIRKGQVAIAPANDMKAQGNFIAALFSVAA